MHDRSMAETALVEALKVIIERGPPAERQLANLCKDLIGLTGHQPEVRKYIDMQAVRVLEEAEHPWG